MGILDQVRDAMKMREIYAKAYRDLAGRDLA